VKLEKCGEAANFIQKIEFLQQQSIYPLVIRLSMV